MTAPSPTNTAGLEVVAWAWDHWTHLTDKWTRRATFDEPQDGSRVRNIEPLVTAASAQARIEALTRRRDELLATTNAYQARYRAAEARVAELEAAKWEAQHADTMNDLVAMGLARDAAEARADRLAEALEYAKAQLWDRPARSDVTLVRLRIDAALQDQPK